MKQDVSFTKQFYLLKGLLPICLGFGVTVYLFYREFGSDIPTLPMDLNWGVVVAALGCICIRDYALAARFRLLCQPASLTWKRAFCTNYLCEFTSAITPSSVGGSALIMFYLHREGISIGRGIAVMIASLFLDELLFVVACPLCFLLVPLDDLFGLSGGWSAGMRIAFLCVYLCVVVYTALLFIALFKKPTVIKTLLLALAKLPLLRKRKLDMLRFYEELEISGAELQRCPMRYWLRAMAQTFVAWIARYAVACVLFSPFIPMGKQVVVMCRQFILWIVTMIAPTPGGSGVSEYLFMQYYSDLQVMDGDVLLITLFWRLVTYYLYLLIGFCLLPGWLRKNPGLPKSYLKYAKE